MGYLDIQDSVVLLVGQEQADTLVTAVIQHSKAATQVTAVKVDTPDSVD